MKAIAFLLLSCTLWACGEKKDELGPYTAKLIELDGLYVTKLKEYRGYLSTPGMGDKAADVKKVMQEFHDELAAYPEINNKKVKALHNELQRTLKGSMRKLVEPDFPTFVPNAQRAINIVEDELVVIHTNLEKLWTGDDRTDAFPLKWKRKESD
ncbi:MAG: hypothetical protein ACKVJG_13280 [Candidatus Latescibacterota bacterium]|jgi:polyhydroxyalkanoate synthesis regulator phasin